MLCCVMCDETEIKQNMFSSPGPFMFIFSGRSGGAIDKRLVTSSQDREF